MEIRWYLSTLRRYWWVIFLTTLAAGVGSYALSTTRTPTYTASVRVAVGPAPTLTDTRTLVDLAGQSGYRYVAGTYAQYLTASTVKSEAEEAAGISREESDSYSVKATVLPDTTVIVVTATGPDAAKLSNYLNATVDASIVSTRDLYKVMELLPLETAQPPEAPSSPQPLRDVPLGTVFGLAVGVMLALLIEYVSGSNVREVQRVAAARIAYSESHLRSRRD